MDRRHIKYLFFIIYSFCFSSIGETFKIYGVNEPPASYISNNGEVAGYVVDITNALLHELNIKADIEILPEARVLNFAKNRKNILLFSFSRTPFREKHFHWIGKVLTKKWQAFALSNSLLEITSLSDLKQVDHIGVVRGDVREEWLVNRGFDNLYSVTYPDQNVRLLAKGRLPVIIYEQQGMSYLCRQLNIENNFKPLFTVHESDVYLLMSKQTSMAVVTRVKKAFEQLKRSGRLAEISEKWLSQLAIEYPDMYAIKDDILTF
ncbi:substrate-binding periplasmic protein [Thalassotalea sediminis]|uniref:substrate-binding periplasmic protein n=1 Tax=Thalassotalea sediminis TaxID=1759089 RepID=UPI002572A9EB|nr:transporter substrate-binding domain-containing protein [Thalassotalea sediminis]